MSEDKFPKPVDLEKSKTPIPFNFAKMTAFKKGDLSVLASYSDLFSSGKTSDPI